MKQSEHTAPAPLVNDRAALALAIKSLKERGVITPDTVISPSYLRRKQTLSNNISQYNFQVSEGQGTTAIDEDEQLLNINDAFFCTHLGFYLVPEDTTGNLNQPYNTFANGVEFVNTGTSADLEVVYKGSFSVQVQSTVVYDNVDLQRFREVPQTQQALATDFSQFNPNQGLMELTPNLILNGRANNRITAQLPTEGGVDWAGSGNFENKLVFVAHGFLAKNVNFANVK